MATINPHRATDFDKDLRDFLALREGNVRRIYSDDKGIPTMGIGFALFHEKKAGESGGPYKYRGGSRENFQKELSGLNITLDESDWFLLDQALLALNSGDVSYVKTLIPPAASNEKNGGQPIPANNSFGLTLDEADVEALLNRTLTEARKTLHDKLGEPLYKQFDGSKEMIALQSLAFNHPNKLIGPKLVRALKNGDRAEAWFEIRYGSNADYQNANRRYHESDLFGLYNENPSEEDFLAVYRMYTRHREDTLYNQEGLLGYEGEWAPPATGAYQSLEEAFQPAYDFLINKYDELVDIDYRDIQVAEENGSWLLGTVRDGNRYGIGIERNDLMIGGNGSDILEGLGGDDILHGGGGSDYLDGGSGENWLYGGEGEDTYILNGDGSSINHIIDEGANRIILNGRLVVDAINAGDGTWVSADGRFTYTRNSPLIITDNLTGDQVIVDDHQDGEFGINLRDGYTLPEITGRVIEGDLAPTRPSYPDP